MKEVFKDIPGYEGKYQVSNLGKVKSLERWRNTGSGGYIQKENLLKFQLDQQGYYRLVLHINSTPNMIHVHRLVAITFLNHKPNGFKGLVINHKNFIKTDNRVENIELTTQRNNANQNKIKELWQR